MKEKKGFMRVATIMLLVGSVVALILFTVLGSPICTELWYNIFIIYFSNGRMEMSNGTNYRFRVRSDDVRFRRKSRELSSRSSYYDCFSLPQRDDADLRSHETIVRPGFEGMELAVLKYL